MKKLLLTILSTSVLLSYSLEEFYKDYKEEKYDYACKKGVTIFSQNRQDENYLTVYSFACLKSDMIDRLAVPITGLRESKEARANASYFSAILLQKKLLYHAVIDGTDIKGLNFPTTEFVLSRIFDMYVDEDYTKKDETYHFSEDGGHEYEMYVEQGQRYKKLVIKHFKDGTLINTHNYF